MAKCYLDTPQLHVRQARHCRLSVDGMDLLTQIQHTFTKAREYNLTHVHKDVREGMD